MIVVLLSAFFVGFVHSLNPGHWLPVVLMSKSRRWPLRTSIAGAFCLAAGHILISSVFGIFALWVGTQLLSQHEDRIEKWAGLLMALFGVGYGIISYFKGGHCEGHHHEGHHHLPRSRSSRKTPFFFLFSLGFSPCIAVLPVFTAAAVEGSLALCLAVVTFSVGVVCALVGATLLANLGLMKLDHPVFEHYGDVITGLGVTVMGLILFAIS